MYINSTPYHVITQSTNAEKSNHTSITGGRRLNRIAKIKPRNESYAYRLMKDTVKIIG